MEFDTRNTPDSLCCALQGLSDAQSSDIEDMGFGSIKSFSIHDIPTGLGHWLLVNYDHKRNELNVGNRGIKITPAKVHEVLGVPMGKITVSEKRKARKIDVVREEWRKQFANAGKITVKHVLDKLKLYREGGTLFKLNFLVVFNTVMGETTRSESVNQKFLTSLKSEDAIAKMDWCSYIITCLKRTKEGWDGIEPYTGPLTFLAVLYAHEQQLKCTPEKAITPAITYVTTDYLVNLERSMCDNGPCLNDGVEEDNQLTQYVDVQVPLETHIVSAEGQIDEVQAVIDQNVNLLIGPSGAQSLSGLSTSLGRCNLLEPPKDVILIEDDVVILDIKQERCELVEKFSSPPQRGTVCVQGYSVKRSVAKTLEAIFKEHGDIAAECVCKTDTFRSSILETVCEDAQLIQNNDFNGKLEDIERRVLDAKAVNINVSWLQAQLEAIRKRKETHEEYKLLMEMKAPFLMAKKAAEINLGKRRAELAVVQERSKEAKRSVEVAHLVGRNLIDSFFKCRAETDMWAKAAVV